MRTSIFCWLLLISFLTKAQTSSLLPKGLKKEIIQDLEIQTNQYNVEAKQIWNYAEVGYKEEKSAAILIALLKQNGFKIEQGVAGIPTAFVASYGQDKPTIAILAEYDALPGLSQDTLPTKKVLTGKDAGHGCGHNLFGVASTAAAIAIKKQLETGQLKGSIKLFGCPAEEGGSGKVYMVRAGLFNAVDVALHWHPGDQNAVRLGSSLANISAKFRFSGISAHAAAAPERGRSSLDGVEAMDMMVNMMREHIPSSTRIHYIITNGGKAPNVVPDFSEVYYYVRDKDREVVRSVFDRVINAAQGAALGTGTQMEYEVLGGVYNLLPNKTLAKTMFQNLQLVGGVAYTAADKLFAQQLQQTLGDNLPKIEQSAQITEFSPSIDLIGSASTDVADVSWAVPTVGLSAATWVPGTPAHSWQAVAASGMDIGLKGMMVAAKTVALTAVDLYKDKTIIQEAKAEFEKVKGPGFQYKPLLGDRKPALNYRD